ncbi:MAG: hypothetical protein AAB074_19130 [Planctomycetota bacterium]
MRVYEVVKDHKSGLTKVLSYEEKPDPFSRAAMRRHGEDKRARIASLKAWWIALRYSWRDRALRTRIVGHTIFFLAVSVCPVVCAVFSLMGLVGHSIPANWDDYYTAAAAILGVVFLVFAALWLRSMKRKLFGR